MARHYSTNEFFRQMPVALLGRYFGQRGVLVDLDFSELSEAQPETLLEAWLAVDETQRHAMDAEFREIFELSCEKGFRAIIDEADWHYADDAGAKAVFVETLANLESHFERAMVTFLDHDEFWKGATLFCHADTLSYWRKRKNLPNVVAATDTASLGGLAGAIRRIYGLGYV